MVRPITVNDFLSNSSEFSVIDVRSEKEFSAGHIAGAVNIPILEDEERRIVGTTYKQNGRQPAVYKGLELSGPHLSDRLRQGVKHSRNAKVLVHCWRGGMRSEFYSFLLHYYGLEPYMLIGGYKSYRNQVHASFEGKLNLTVLSGKTGSAKTEILNRLAAAGEQVIDLEFLAKHRGSSFGALAFDETITQEQFENDLFEVIRHLDPCKRIWIEDENRTIGDKVIPQGIWGQMKNAPIVLLERAFDERLEQIVMDYGHFKKEDLRKSMERIGKRLGPQHVKAALEFLAQGDYRSAFSIALKYYDKAYDHQMEDVKSDQLNRLNVKGLNLEEVVDRLVSNNGK
jgi:tRNA 2-selenouridine synthase